MMINTEKLFPGLKEWVKDQNEQEQEEVFAFMSPIEEDDEEFSVPWAVYCSRGKFWFNCAQLNMMEIQMEPTEEDIDRVAREFHSRLAKLASDVIQRMVDSVDNPTTEEAIRHYAEGVTASAQGGVKRLDDHLVELLNKFGDETLKSELVSEFRFAVKEAINPSQ